MMEKKKRFKTAAEKPAYEKKNRTGNRNTAAGRQEAKAESLDKENKPKPRRCPYSKHCGGCTMIESPYADQLVQKQQYVESCVGKFGPVAPIIAMKNPDHYRNKITRVFGTDRRGKPICGIYRKDSHEIVPVEKCLIEDPRGQRIAKTILSLLPSFKIRIYDEDRGTGILRYVQIRTARATGQVMVTLVAASPIFPSKNNFVAALRKIHPDITTVILNVNTRTDSMILGDREIVLYGPGYIEDTLCGKTFRISSASFYQVNPIQTEKLYNIAVDGARLSGKEAILDAYCGIGTIGLIAADRAKQATLVELNPEAVKNAVRNAAIADIKNAAIFQGDAGEFMAEAADMGEIPMDVLFMDPPRAGASEEFLDAAVRMAPKRIVYISCDPSTLMRDLGYLTENGYKMHRATPVDMFPATAHVETVVLLCRKAESADRHITIEYNPNGRHMEKAPLNASYPQIQEWISEHYNGMKVHSLYIAQVKQKHGLIERENYNKSKKPDAKVPQCPSAKEAAIEAALRHFNIIK